MKEFVRRPPPGAVLMQRIDKAALSDSRGEVALSVATALGNRGPGDLAPDVVVRLDARIANREHAGCCTSARAGSVSLASEPAPPIRDGETRVPLRPTFVTGI